MLVGEHMTQYELSQYYFALSEQAEWMEAALMHYQFGDEERVWYDLLRWAAEKHRAREIADAHDTMSFAKAMGISDGIRKAWE
jgi:hypothetical protein